MIPTHVIVADFGGSSSFIVFPNFTIALLLRLLRLLRPSTPLPPSAPAALAAPLDAGRPAGGGAALLDLRWAALTLVARFLAHGGRRDGDKSGEQIAKVRTHRRATRFTSRRHTCKRALN